MFFRSLLSILWLQGISIFLFMAAASAQNNDAFQNNFMPHGVCLNWNPRLLQTMILANIGIAVAYFAIPAALWYFVRHKKDLPYPWVFQLFGMFIVACGLTHLMKVWTLYQPFYWAEAGIDTCTAIISLITAMALWPLIPKALQLRSPKELEQANKQLEESIARDRKISAELQEQATLMDLAHDAIMVTDWDGTIRFWNSGAKEIYGYTQDEAMGANYYSLLKAEFPISREEIREHLITDGRWDGETINYKSNGEKIIIGCRQALKRDEQGNPIAVLAINSDITQHKRAEQRRIALAEVQRSNLELQQFAYIASHDLQEPLRAVAGCLQILEKNYKGKLDADADELIRLSVDSAVRMRTLINDLLALSHINSDNISHQQVNLSHALSTATQNLALRIAETETTVICDSLPSVNGDKTQLTQLFQNLINNAIKFCDKNPEIRITARQQEDIWLISVQDNGIGFEQQYAERVFQPFKRLHTQDKYPGTGMGLTICKRIIERHEGKIWVESTLGEGTTFYFTLPVK